MPAPRPPASAPTTPPAPTTPAPRPPASAPVLPTQFPQPETDDPPTGGDGALVGTVPNPAGGNQSPAGGGAPAGGGGGPPGDDGDGGGNGDDGTPGDDGENRDDGDGDGGRGGNGDDGDDEEEGGEIDQEEAADDNAQAQPVQLSLANQALASDAALLANINDGVDDILQVNENDDFEAMDEEDEALEGEAALHAILGRRPADDEEEDKSQERAILTAEDLNSFNEEELQLYTARKYEFRPLFGLGNSFRQYVSSLFVSVPTAD